MPISFKTVFRLISASTAVGAVGWTVYSQLPGPATVDRDTVLDGYIDRTAAGKGSGHSGFVQINAKGTPIYRAETGHADPAAAGFVQINTKGKTPIYKQAKE